MQMYLNGGTYGGARILTAESVKDATSPHTKADGDSSYGLGWMVSPDGTFSHSGSDGTIAWVDPGRELIAMVLTQSPGGINPVREFRTLVAEACLPAAK